MENIKVISDSLADIPKHLIDKYDIEVIPLTIRIKDIDYKDGIDISNEEFYKKLNETKEIPKTSQATYIQFKEMFEKYIQEGKKILYISGSSKVTGTYQSSVMAKNDIENNKDIHIFDSLNLSYGCGTLVIAACDMINNNYCINKIIDKLEKMRETTTVLFAVDTLEYLQKGGRISSTKAIAGTMLRVKPILEVKNGEIKNVAQVRGKKNAILKLIELVNGRYENLEEKNLTLGHGDNKEQFDILKEHVIDELYKDDINNIEIGCSIGSHVGPGTIGICISDK